MAKAATITIVEAEEIVPIGAIHPDDVHLPGIYVDRIVPSTVEKVIEIKKLKDGERGVGDGGKKSESLIRRERIARRTAKELKDGFYVNLGVGMPTLAPSFLEPGTKVWIQSENGVLGMVGFFFLYLTELKLRTRLIKHRVPIPRKKKSMRNPPPTCKEKQERYRKKKHD